MGCQSNNATPPAPAIAPGVESIDPFRAAAEIGARGVDPRLPVLVPGFDAPFFQAGLAGYSDAAMRLVARRHGCPMCVTEALLDRTLLSGGRGFARADLGEIHDNVPGGREDHPLVGQIMGSDPETMADAAAAMIERNAQEHAGFEAIDVNLACPVRKIARKARGGHWLREPEGAIDILRAVREAVPSHIPTSVKLRRGSDDSPEAERNFLRIFDAAYDLGYAWTTVHGRTVEQKYVGPSRWTFLRDLVRRNPDRLIFGSGDVWRVEDVFLMLAYTGVHAVSVARGCIGNPWVFRQARDMMAGLPPRPPTLAEQRDALRAHFELSVSVNGEQAAGKMMRKFGIRFAQHHPRPEDVKRAFIGVTCTEEWMRALDAHYPTGDEAAAGVVHAVERA
ncbi:MAG: tRNA-dihydrouridine synthase family protein [Phycisphaerales bacterium]|nr:MAG: tRNA-dihydrouridine synthase family protein [Phycisphaerales bacterium]